MTGALGAVGVGFIARDAAVLLSLALQHGTSIESIKHAVTRDSSGAAASILGAIVDAIADGDGRGGDHESA